MPKENKVYQDRIAELLLIKEKQDKILQEKSLKVGRDPITGRLLPGHTANRAGKKRGTKNRWSKDVKATLRKAVAPFLSKINEDLEKMEPVDRIKAIAIILKLAETRGKGINGTGYVENNVTFEVTYSDEYKRKKRSNTIDISPKDYQIEESKDEDEEE